MFKHKKKFLKLHFLFLTKKMQSKNRVRLPSHFAWVLRRRESLWERHPRVPRRKGLWCVEVLLGNT